MNALCLEQIALTRGRAQVLCEIDLALNIGEVLGLIGPNGAGKSSLLEIAAGLIKPDRGMVRIAQQISSSAACERESVRSKARRIGFLPQDRVCHWSLDVEYIVRLGRFAHVFHAARAQSDDVVEQTLALLGLGDLRNRTFDSLSGGEQARVLLARALAAEPEILLADEPLSGLDPAQQIAMLRVFRDYARRGRSVLLSLHDLNLALGGCDRVAVLDHGRIVRVGTPGTVIDAQLIAQVYGVCAQVHRSALGPYVIYDHGDVLKQP